MLVGRRDGVMLILSSIGLVRCHVTPRVGAAAGAAIGGSNSGSISRLSRRSGSKTCDANAIIGRDGAVDHAKSDDVSDDPFLGNLEEWDTWEFGSWKTGTHAEHMAEAEARATELASLPALVGGGAGLTEQTEAELDRAIRVLRVYLTEDRISRMKDVLDQRTKSATIVFENPCNPNNVWACLRTMDSFGVQHAHIVSDPSTYNKKARLKTMCAAMGSQKWLTLHGHNSPEDAVAKLKVEGYQVVASDLSPSAVPIGEIDWSVPTAVVLGNEERGISDSMRDLADATFMIPMRGFVRSFNMSVACSILLAHLSAVRALRHGDLPEHERRRVTATWYMQSVKGSDRILRREGIVVPQSVYRPKGDRSQTVAGYHVR
ncbi:unnamed protein product [Ascophyllum nodosum]